MNSDAHGTVVDRSTLMAWARAQGVRVRVACEDWESITYETLSRQQDGTSLVQRHRCVLPEPVTRRRLLMSYVVGLCHEVEGAECNHVRRGDLAAVMAICGAAVVHLTSLLVFVGLLGNWLLSILPAGLIEVARLYILPAVLGAVLVQCVATMPRPRPTAIAVAAALLIQFALIPVPRGWPCTPRLCAWRRRWPCPGSCATAVRPVKPLRRGAPAPFRPPSTPSPRRKAAE